MEKKKELTRNQNLRSTTHQTTVQSQGKDIYFPKKISNNKGQKLCFLCFRAVSLLP